MAGGEMSGWPWRGLDGNGRHDADRAAAKGANRRGRFGEDGEAGMARICKEWAGNAGVAS